MKINLERPLAFFDLETTGTNVATDRIVEISIIKVNPDQSKDKYTKRINPTIPIPAASSAIHGIYDKDVASAPTFEYLAQEVYDFIGDADLAGYNSNRFDIPLLIEEFFRVSERFDITKKRFVDVQTIFHKMEQRTLVAAYKFYCDKELVNAHSAEADVIATIDVLESQLDRYPELENSIDHLAEFSRGTGKNVDFAGRIIMNENDEEIFNFGKHKGKTVESILTNEPSYYGWMMNADFPRYTKKVLKEIRTRMQEKQVQ
ncbi:MAG: 3'-5' exonuclease [Flavobacteriales bacterium]|nr:3'-5' exonuclease [Flavobacteriales bacterium]